MTVLGYIGLGNMGAPMAKRLVDWPGGLVVYDVRAKAMVPFVDAGARGAGSLADFASADLVSITVLDDAQVREVVGELAGHVRPGTVLAIHSTVADGTAAELAAGLADKGIHVVDAPVSGGAPAAAKGQLATMVGATAEAFELVREPFAWWAGLVVHAGAPGAGTRMKLARNLLHFVAFAAVGEAQRLAADCGLDITALGKVVRHTDALTGGAGSIMLRDNVNQLDPKDPWYPILSHVRDLGEKDLGLALALAADRGVDLPLAELALLRLAFGLGVAHRAPAE